MKLIKKEYILLVILSLGLFLRIYDLGNESIWLDEEISIRLANLSLFEIIDSISQDTHPPLYCIILHYWVNLFGNSEFSARFLSVIFGFFALLMIYKVGRLMFCKDVGIYSSLLLALSVFHIHYSQEVRMYSLLSLLTLISFYFFINLLKKRSLLVSIGYLASSVLLIHTQVVGVFVIIAQNIYLFTVFFISTEGHNLNFKKWISLQVILVVLFTPWIWVFINHTTTVEIMISWISVPSLGSLKSSFIEYAGSRPLLLLFLVLSSFSLVTYKKISGTINLKDFFKSIESYSWNICPTNISKLYLLSVWLLTPVIFPFIISQFSMPIYITRVTIPASLAFYLLVGKGIKNIHSTYIKSIIICVIIAFSLISVRGYYTKVDKEPWRDVTHYVDTNAEQGDLLLFNSGSLKHVFNHYSKRTDLIKKPFPGKTKYVDGENIKELDPIIKNYDRIWFVLSHSGDDKGVIKKILSKYYQLSCHKTYLGIELHLFEKLENKSF